MRRLTTGEKKQLRGLAHELRPLLHIGKDGLTDAVVRQLDQTLFAHELVKVKFLATDREQQRAFCAAIAERLQCELAGSIGHVAIAFRQHPEAAKRQIEIAEMYV
jgi:RNA-binding protein